MRERGRSWRALGFRCNPFRALDPDEWGRLAVLIPALQEALPGAAHLQVRGARGSGKTSALLGLQARFEAQGLRTAYERIPEHGFTFHTAAQNLDVLLIDEAQRLWPPAWLRLLAAGRRVRLALGSHANHAWSFRLAGQPLVSVDLDALDQGHFRAALAARLEHFALGDRPHVTIAPAAFDALWARCGRDLRAAEEVLYGVFLRLEGLGEVGPAHLEDA